MKGIFHIELLDFDTYGGFYEGHTSKRFVVSLCIVKGIFLEGISPISRLL